MELSRIVASSDFSENSLPAVEAALGLASESGATLYLVHVLEIPAIIPSPTAMVPTMEDLAAAARKRLSGLIPGNLPEGLEIETVILNGVAATEIADFARQKQADMIVVGTHGRKGLRRLLLGSTAESLLRNAPCQILVVKPRRLSSASKHPLETSEEEAELSRQ